MEIYTVHSNPPGRPEWRRVRARAPSLEHAVAEPLDGEDEHHQERAGRPRLVPILRDRQNLDAKPNRQKRAKVNIYSTFVSSARASRAKK